MIGSGEHGPLGWVNAIIQSELVTREWVPEKGEFAALYPLMQVPSCPLPSVMGEAARNPSLWPGLPSLQNRKTKSSLQKDIPSWDFCYGSLRWVGRACVCVTASTNTCEIHLCNCDSGSFIPFAAWGYSLSRSMHHHHHWLVWRTLPCL